MCFTTKMLERFQRNDVGKISVFLVDALLQIQEQNAAKAIKCTTEGKL